MYLDLISVVVEAEQQEEVIWVYSASDEVEDERHLSEEFQREELKGKETSEEKKYIQEKNRRTLSNSIRWRWWR